MKAKDFRDQSVEELNTSIDDLRKSLFENQFKHGTRQLTDTAILSRMKKDIARAETVLREKLQAPAA